MNVNERGKTVLIRVVPLAVSCGIFLLLFRNIDAAMVLRTFRESDRRLIVSACIFSLSVKMLLGTFKWKIILSGMDCRIGYLEALTVRAGTIPFRLLMPLKSFELLKAAYLKRRKGFPFTAGVSSLIVDKTSNLMVTLVIFLSAAALTGMEVTRGVPAVLLLVTVLAMFSKRTRDFISSLGEKVWAPLGGISGRLFGGFDDISMKRKVNITALSFIYQSSEFVNTFLLLKAAGADPTYLSVLLFVPLIMIVNNIPVTVLGLGTREALFVFLFVSAGTPHVLLSAGMLVSVVEYIVPVLAGLFFMGPMFSYLSFRPLKEERTGGVD